MNGCSCGRCAFALAAALAACTPTSPAREERAALAAVRGEEETPAPAGEPEPTRAASPAPELTLTAEVGASEVTPVVQNHDRVPAKLASALQVERERASGFVALDGAALALRASCEAPAPPCLELVPGAELRPPPWRASVGRAQCGESPAPKPEPGRYRFVARTCDGAARIEGAPFELR